jgi:ABC-2 type transport system ATP-binding protein
LRSEATGFLPLMIEAHHLTKRYGNKLAVSDLSFTVKPGVVSGFLGPNGAGKSTTMRLIVGLAAPTSGEVTVNGRRYTGFAAPLREVGLLLEARSAHPGRTAYNHLLALAQTHGIARGRVDELIDLVGLTDVAHKRAGGFSLGMAQRLGIAAALLGDPGVLILDEPVNGLDPEGIRSTRALLKSLAAEGRTVLLSSHLMSEMQLTAEHLIVIGRGRLIADLPLEEFVGRHSQQSVRVRSPHANELVRILARADVSVAPIGPSLIDIHGITAEQIGVIAAEHQIVLYELTPQRASLEQAYMDLTRDEAEYRASAQGGIAA